MDQLRRVGGALEPIRRPSGHRLLLPYELDLCESLGITPEEYWEFIFAAQEHVKKRGPEYAHIPDVRNDPVTLIINLVIGIALSAVGALLAPKPKAPTKRDPKRLDIAGSQGRTRYTRTNNFDSVQQLANLGEIVPLIFANYRTVGGVNYGGIRVETDLLHSQLISSGSNQLLYALMTFGAGPLGEKPDFDGYAIGDLLLRDFAPEKVKLYYEVGQRLLNSHAYDRSKLPVPEVQDAFSLYWPKGGGSWQKYFSGTRSPSTKIQFGCYGPIANGHRFYLPLELVMVVDFSGKETKEDSRRKREKLGMQWPRLCGITNVRGKNITYQLSDYEFDDDPDKYRPWGLSDMITFQNESRSQADEALQTNQDFMFGAGAIGRVIRRVQSKPFDPLADNKGYSYDIRLDDNQLPNTETGIDYAYKGQIHKHTDGEGKKASERGAGFPWERSCIQQVAIASLTNNRPCHATEIGIKSEVWRQMTGAVNFNGWPTDDTVEKYEHKGGQITVGTVTKYMKRYSFFKLYVRALNDPGWTDITGDTPFAVCGVSPTNQYNSIHIEHPGGQLSVQEYKLAPVPGYKFYNRLLSGSTQVIRLFNGAEMSTAKTTYNNGQYKISYTGANFTLTADLAANPEWYFNESVKADFTPSGPIASLESYGIDYVPTVPDEDKYLSTGNYKPTNPGKTCIQRDFGSNQLQYFWNGKVESKTNGDIQYRRGEKRQDAMPARWEAAANSPDHQVSDDANAIFLTGYYNCVVVQNGKYIYRWQGQTVATSNVKTKNRQEVTVNGKRSSYRIELTPDGAYTQPQTTYDINFVDDDMWYDLYDTKEKSGGMKTGARKLDDGRFKFWKDGNVLGTNNGNGKNLYDGEVGKSHRWRATTLMQEEIPGDEESLGKQRICDTERDSRLDKCVTTGYAVMGKVEIKNPNNSNDKKEVDEVKMYIDGELVYHGPDTTWEGRHMSYPEILGEGKTTLNGVQYRPWFKDDPLYCGRDTDKKPVYKWKVFRITEKQYEQWAITRQYANEILESYGIEKENFIDGQPDKWEIEKWEINRTKPEEPEIRRVDIRSKKNNEADDDDDNGRNTSAKALLKHYRQSDLYSWTIDNNGDDYEVGEPVFIGKGLGLRTTVTSIKVDDVDLDPNPGWGDLIKDGSNYFPLNAICDYYINNTDTSSHANGPEHTICFCNEIIKQSAPPTYGDDTTKLALAGIKLTNSKEWTNFSNLSAWLAKGLEVERLVASGRGPTNLFPEIAYALLTDPKLGAGELIGSASVDRDAMKLAAQFCQANNFYWDGVIAESVNLREFIFEQAAFILCDFTIKGGQFALVPSVPYGSDKRINPSQAITVKALFTDGNMKEGSMKVTFLSPEERQPFKAVVLYREETRNGFAETRSLTTWLKSSGDVAPVEEFDLTPFCTSEVQARTFARIALKMRDLVDHGIQFETTPQSAMTLEPGDYFKVATKVTHTDRFQSGMVDSQGYVVSSEQNASGSSRVVYWKPGETQTREGTLTFSGGKTSQSTFFGCIWAKVQEAKNTRVYKCETLSYAEDGLVSVSGSYAPLNDRDQLQILNYSDNDFKEELA